MFDLVSGERQRREALWETLIREDGTRGVPPYRLRELGIYGGAQGVWVNKRRTGGLTANSAGVTVALLHTGRFYADDLADDGVLYHYPITHRPAGRDLAEVEATKSAARLRLPVFVITHASPQASLRSVHLAWVEDWNDRDGLFLVTFAEAFPVEEAIPITDETPFELVDRRQPARREVNVREGQQRFKFRVLERYGAACAVCGMSVLDVLDAAHLRPKHAHGSDDPRNGLVLCAVHHRAFDAGLFAFEPGTLAVHYRAQGPDAKALRIIRADLRQLPLPPHPEAVKWLWLTWNRQQSESDTAVQAG